MRRFVGIILRTRIVSIIPLVTESKGLPKRVASIGGVKHDVAHTFRQFALPLLVGRSPYPLATEFFWHGKPLDVHRIGAGKMSVDGDGIFDGFFTSHLLDRDFDLFVVIELAMFSALRKKNVHVTPLVVGIHSAPDVIERPIRSAEAHLDRGDAQCSRQRERKANGYRRAARDFRLGKRQTIRFFPAALAMASRIGSHIAIEIASGISSSRSMRPGVFRSSALVGFDTSSNRS